MLATYRVEKEYNASRVIFSRRPNTPITECKKWFQRGELIKGELKHLNNKPAVVITPESGWIFPVDVLKEVITKDLSGDAASSNSDGDGKKDNPITGLAKTAKTPKIMYGDGLIIGAIIGAAAVYGCEKKGWLVSVGHKNKIYGAIGGAFIGWYLVFRHRQNSSADKKKE